MKIVISVCGYRPIERLTHWSLCETLRCPEPEFFVSALKGVAGPDVGRSLAASRVLMSGKNSYDAVLFVDDDITFDPYDAVRLAHHVKHGKSIIGACYVTKSDKPRPTCRFFDGQSIDFKKEAEPVKIRYLAGGFMMAHRSVLESMSKKLPLCNSKEDMSFWPFFMPFVKKVHKGLFKSEDEYLTEDFAFCERARDYGFDVWLDPGIRLGHVGEKVYALEDMFADKPGIMDVVNLKKQ